MKPIIFDREISQETVSFLISQIDEAYRVDPSGITIYFSGSEIDLGAEAVLLNYLGTLDQGGAKIKLVANHKLYDSAFSIFFKYIGEKEILRTATGQVKVPYGKEELQKIMKQSRPAYKSLKLENEYYLKWLNPVTIFSKTEWSKIKRSVDVFLDNERLQRIMYEFRPNLIKQI